MFGADGFDVMREPEALRLAEELVHSALADSRGQGSSLDFSTPLFDGGLELDSIAFLEFVIALETRLGMKLRSEELIGEALETVGGLARHVARLIAQDEGTERTLLQSDVANQN
jgi:acyl carrier protein